VGDDRVLARILSDAGLQLLPGKVRPREGRAWLVGWRGTCGVLRQLPVPVVSGTVLTQDVTWLHGFLTRLAVLNALTTRTSITTIVRIQGTGCELFLLYTRLTPEQLRITTSHPLGAIRSARAAEAAGGIHHQAPAVSRSPVEELAKLTDMLEEGLLAREEFDVMKGELLSHRSSDTRGPAATP
jgi:hypothetical protein